MIKSKDTKVIQVDEFLTMKILLSQAKLFFIQGLLSGWYLEKVPNTPEWIVHLTFSDFTLADAMIIDARRREVRQQKLVACINTLEDIGFVVNTIQSSGKKETKYVA